MKEISGLIHVSWIFLNLSWIHRLTTSHHKIMQLYLSIFLPSLPSSFIYSFSFSGIGDRTKGLKHARQAPLLSCTPSPYSCFLNQTLSDRISKDLDQQILALGWRWWGEMSATSK